MEVKLANAVTRGSGEESRIDEDKSAVKRRHRAAAMPSFKNGKERDQRTSSMREGQSRETRKAE